MNLVFLADNDGEMLPSFDDVSADNIDGSYSNGSNSKQNFDPYLFLENNVFD